MFGQGYVFGVIPIPVLVMAISFAIGVLILNRTYFGRFFYAVGGNYRASELSGIGNAGLGYEFKVITCVVLGGVSVSGGYGKMSGVIAGTCIIGVLQSGMVFMNLDAYTQDILMGIVLACAVGFDCIQSRRNNSRRLAS